MELDEHVARALYALAWGDSPKWETLDETDQMLWMGRAQVSIDAVREYEARGWVSI